MVAVDATGSSGWRAGDELNNRGVSLFGLGRTAEAERAFAAALAADPMHAQAVYHLGLSLWRRGALTDQDLVGRMQAVRDDGGDPWRARLLLAHVHVERGDLDAARELLDGVARERPDEPDVRAALDLLGAGDVTGARCTGASEPAWRARPSSPVAVTADGTLGLSGEADGTVRLWTLADGRCARTLAGHTGPVTAVDISADGRRAVSAGSDDRLRLWDLETGDHAADAASAGAVGLSADGGVAVFACWDGTLRVFDARGGRITRTVKVGRAEMRSMIVSPDGRRAMTYGFRAREPVRLWDLETGECRHAFGESVPGATKGFSPDGRFAATVGAFGTPVRIWDVADGRSVRVLEDAHASGPLALSDGARYMLAAEGERLRYWDVEDGRCLRTFAAHRGPVRVVRLSPDGRTGLSVGNEDGTVRRWRMPRNRRVAAPSPSRPRPRTGPDAEADRLVAAAERALAGDRVPEALDLLTKARAVPGHERTPHVMAAWRALGARTVRTGLRGARAAATLTGHHGDVRTVAITADGRLAASGGDDGTVRLWDLATGTRVRTLTGPGASVCSLHLGADGSRLLSGAWSGEVRLWDTRTGACLRVLPDSYDLLDPDRWSPDFRGCTRIDVPGGGTLPDDVVGGGAHVRFVPGERRAAVGGVDGITRLWDLATGRLVHAMDGADGARGLVPDDVRIGAVAVGGGLVASAHPGRVRLWDAGGRDAGELRVPTVRGRLSAVALTADGRSALAADQDGCAMHLWDVAERRHVRTFDGAPGWETDLAFVADDRFAVSAHLDGVHVWDVGEGERLRVLGDSEHGGASCVAATPGGRFVLAGEPEGAVRLWELDWDLG